MAVNIFDFEWASAGSITYLNFVEKIFGGGLPRDG
jgi:hypothetical protein